MSDSKAHIAVIGAGLSGLACAKQLQQAGYAVSVFEKSRGVGGRMSTRRVCDEPNNKTADSWQCDHGAQYFTARDPQFVSQTNQWLAAGVISVWSPTLHSFGVKPDRQSPQSAGVTRFVGVPGMTAPVRQLASKLSVRLQSRVIAVSKQAQHWMLAIEDDSALAGPFDQIVFALPAQQLDDLLVASADVPAAFVNDARQSTQQHPLSPCWALMLDYREKLPVSFDAAFVNAFADAPLHHDHTASAQLSWIARDSSKPGRPAGEVWVLHASTAWTNAHLEDQQLQVFQSMLGAFNSLTGVDQERYHPHSWKLHRWRYAQALQIDNTPGFIWHAGHGLGVCGDWLNKGRVEGAWLSGYQLAQALISGH
jgi:predicted NAD/FAD-dependent oxidoreductase